MYQDQLFCYLGQNFLNHYNREPTLQLTKYPSLAGTVGRFPGCSGGPAIQLQQGMTQNYRAAERTHPSLTAGSNP